MTYLALVPAFELDVNDWSDVSATHKAVMKLFPVVLPGGEGAKRSESNILFRFDDAANGKHLLISADIPVEYPTPGTRKRDFTPPDLAAGSLVHFRTTVNVIKRHGGRAIPSDDIAGWLETRLGEALGEIQPILHSRTIGRLHHGGAASALQMDTIDGIATVLNPHKLNEILRSGVGRAKAYGCGLLSIAGQ